MIQGRLNDGRGQGRGREKGGRGNIEGNKVVTKKNEKGKISEEVNKTSDLEGVDLFTLKDSDETYNDLKRKIPTRRQEQERKMQRITNPKRKEPWTNNTKKMFWLTNRRKIRQQGDHGEIERRNRRTKGC